MHELGIAQNIINIASNYTQSIGSVTKVKCKIGKINAIVPETLKFHFDILKTQYPSIKLATLEIQSSPLIAHCCICNMDLELKDPYLSCTQCKNPLTILSGNEMIVESIEIDTANETAS